MFTVPVFLPCFFTRIVMHRSVPVSASDTPVDQAFGLHYHETGGRFHIFQHLARRTPSLLKYSSWTMPPGRPAGALMTMLAVLVRELLDIPLENHESRWQVPRLS